LAAAATQLSFAPLSDEALGVPTDVFVSSEDIPTDFRWVTSRYDHSTWGMFLIQQQQLDRSVEQAQSSIERLAGPCADEGCAGSWELVTLANGANALLVTGPGSEDQQTNFISFIHPGAGIRVDVEGPPDEFTGEAALEIANVLVSS
jgi:hypothetical protein